MSGTPDWLQSNSNGEEPAAPVFSADLEAVDSGFSDETNSKRQSSSSGDADNGEKSSRPSLCSCRTICLLVVSCAFLALFIFSAVVQNNDLQGIQWIVFYSLHAALAAAFIVTFQPINLFFIFTLRLGDATVGLCTISRIKVDYDTLTVVSTPAMSNKAKKASPKTEGNTGADDDVDKEDVVR